ncbi:PREDICTED: uncharacterized protein LOC108766835 [Trachymyrmex cornetzi]|uniref:uncharacterized protein LOC108766835 n=1 Tax=Trachymyrmex cornetzi TaxID=471704 RepID=UPI00084F3B5B|nr:PREDICTED: uncharacterized protein LOC108766835 [Trachymyrmex cornetzi]
MPCLTLPSIIEKLPQVRVQTKLNISNNVQLADPTYGIPGGEIVSPAESSERRTCHLITNTQLHDQLERFWRQEDVMETRIYSKQEQICVNFYQDTVRREADGRFIVKLPTKPEIVLGQSKELALKRLHSLERRLKRRPELRQLYNEFMEEYIASGYASICSEGEDYESHEHFHTASATKTSTGTSLNDKLMAGPNLQKDLLGIIIRFRIHKYVMTADIAKMFRQIWVAEEDRKFQLVLWREHPESSLQVLRMNTVTYGTTRAPYLAMRCLKEITSEAAKKLAIKQQEKTSITQIKNLTAKGGKEDLLPATEVLERDFYMDDRLWELKLDWDDPLPSSLEISWKKQFDSLHEINEVAVQRNINPDNEAGSIDIYGFGDASEKAYGACLYAISCNKQGKKTACLICAKARVAPRKVLSMPRLELCAALLLVELLKIVEEACKNSIARVYLWSDSTVVLEWIKTPPNQLKAFVANRVARIQELSSEDGWKHVPSADNPADLLSRGITVEQLKKSKLWWEGPEWITSEQHWPQQPNIAKEEASEKITVAMSASIDPPEVLFKQSSYLETLDIKELKEQRSVSKASKLTKMDPFLDEKGMVRVGGRLRHADLTPDQKHQIILPASHHVVTLIFKQEHEKRLHCGPEQLLNSVRQKYWPLNGRREAKRVTRGCVKCFRYKPRTPELKMADLPKDRVTESWRPFLISGVDYAGLLQMRESRRRGKFPVVKVYVAIFVCFSTRAVHLELVTALTTEAFMAALRRFITRRGMCSQLYSDNATNFVGAARELREIYEFLTNNENEIGEKLANQKIEWKFIPPSSPHFGGLWMAAVKALKRHLNTVTRGLIQTYEEYNTLLIEIEAVLNSRPLTPLSADPNDLHLQKVRQHFWKRWQREYLQTLQMRSKWTRGQEKMEAGIMLLLKDDNLPPLRWKLGRVVEIFAGKDGIVRVATVQTENGRLRRAIQKLCPLPINDV